MVLAKTVYFNEESERILREVLGEGEKLSPFINRVLHEYYSDKVNSSLRNKFSDLLLIVKQLNKARTERKLLYLDELPIQIAEQVTKCISTIKRTEKAVMEEE